MIRRGVGEPSPPRLVVDSSVTIAWCFSDERDDYSQAVLEALAHGRAVTPNLWRLEVANTLLVGERRGRSTQADTAAWLGFLSALPIDVDDETNTRVFGDILGLAARMDSPHTTPPIWSWRCAGGSR